MISYNTSTFNISPQFLKSTECISINYGVNEGLQLFAKGGTLSFKNAPEENTLRWIQKNYHESRKKGYRGPPNLHLKVPAAVRPTHLRTKNAQEAFNKLMFESDESDIDEFPRKSPGEGDFEIDQDEPMEGVEDGKDDMGVEIDPKSGKPISGKYDTSDPFLGNKIQRIFDATRKKKQPHGMSLAQAQKSRKAAKERTKQTKKKEPTEKETRKTAQTKKDQLRKQKTTEETKPGPDKEMTEPDKKMEEVSPEVAMNDADQARSSHEPPPGWEDAEQARSSHEPPPEAKAKASPKAKQTKKREETAGPSDRTKRTKKVKRPSEGDIESEVKRLRNEENVEAPPAKITPTENEVTGGNTEENQVETPANDQVATEESPGENTAELEFDGEVQPEETPGEPEGDFDDDLERLMPEDENVNKLEELEKFFDTSHEYDEFFDEVDNDTGTNIRFERHAYEQDEEFIAVVNECQNEINEELRHRADEIHASKMFDTVLEVDDMAKNTWKFIQGQGWTDTRDILKLEQITGREIPEKHTWNSLGNAARKREVDSYMSYEAILKLDYRAVPRDAQILGARFVYTIKDDPVELGKKPGPSHLDEFRRLDARLCVQGYPEELDEDVQSPTANLETLRVILGIAAIRNYDFGVIDISRAYLQSEDLC